MADKGFSEEEKEAMRARAEELKLAKSGNKRVKEEQACLDTIAGLPDAERVMGERIHAIVLELAPHLAAKTMYGMPAWADEGKTLCFFQAASKFSTRYSVLGFEDKATLDDGEMWPTSFAITTWSPSVEKRVTALIRSAVT